LSGVQDARNAGFDPAMLIGSCAKRKLAELTMVRSCLTP